MFKLCCALSRFGSVAASFRISAADKCFAPFEQAEDITWFVYDVIEAIENGAGSFETSPPPRRLTLPRSE